MTSWDEVLDATGAALRGEPDGRTRLTRCWDGTTDHDHAQRCVLAHYLADLQDTADDEIAWDERALAEYRHTEETDLVPIGIPSATTLAPSLHLNLGDGYLRQGRHREAREQLDDGLAAAGHLPDDGYGAHIRRGLTSLADRIDPPT